MLHCNLGARNQHSPGRPFGFNPLRVSASIFKGNIAGCSFDRLKRVAETRCCFLAGTDAGDKQRPRLRKRAGQDGRRRARHSRTTSGCERPKGATGKEAYDIQDRYSFAAAASSNSIILINFKVFALSKAVFPFLSTAFT